jgi:PAS domain S-box-containing protein
MQVRQRLKINVIIAAIMALTIFLVFSLAFYRINLAMEESDVANEILSSSFERNTFRADYLRTNNERAKVQWFDRHDRLGKLLKTAPEKFKDDEDKKTITAMSKDHESTIKLFSGIVKNRETTKAGPGAAELSRAIENRLVTQLNMRLYDKVLNARTLRESAGRHLYSTFNLAGWSVFFIIAVVTAAVITNAWTMGRTIADRIGTLRDGASVIGGGDLGHRINIKGDDEFSELSDAFNAMTAKLSGSYRDLEAEIEERKKAEEALRWAHYELELRVEARTKELKEAKESLELRVAERTTALQAANASLLDSRRAALNMMEDALDARRQAEDANRELRLEVAERERVEAALRESEEGLKRSQEIAHLGSWELDLVNNRLTWSDEVYRIFGLQPQEFGATYDAFLEAVHPDDRIDVNEAYSGSLREGRDSYEIEHRIVKKVTGEIRYVHEKCRHFREATGRIIRSVGMVHDITERRQAEADILKLSEDMAARNLELESANREMESFVYSISHDLRAPIRTMSGFTKILHEDYAGKLDAQGRDYLDRILRGSAKSIKLIDDLLHLSKISRQELDRIEVDLSNKASKAVEQLREMNHDRNVEVIVQEGLTASADPRLIELALSNLLGNAWKFTSKREKARIEFGAVDGRLRIADPGSHETMTEQLKQGKTVYFVRDNGAGFDPAYTEKMFWPFHRLHTEQEFEGTGIGLTIVERVIRRHGGKAWAEGAVGKGATVYFTLG